MAKYVDEKELLSEILISLKNDKLTPKSIEMLQRMVKEITKNFKYKDPMDREDCMQSAIMDCLLYWRNFNPDHPKANVFAYFTQYIKNGSAKGYGELHPETKKKVQKIRLVEEGGVFNI